MTEAASPALGCCQLPSARGAQRPPRFAAVRGPRPPPAAPHVPAVACQSGCHEPAGRVEGRSRPWRLAPAFGRPLDPPGRFVARRHRSPGAGEEPSPTSRQEARTVADHTGTPTPAGTC
jgi:hypothetical protein